MKDSFSKAKTTTGKNKMLQLHIQVALLTTIIEQKHKSSKSIKSNHQFTLLKLLKLSLKITILTFNINKDKKHPYIKTIIT